MIILLVKENRKSSQLNIRNSHGITLQIINKEHEELFEQNNQRIVPGKRTYTEIIKFGKKTYAFSDSYLNIIKKNIFQKLLDGGKIYFNVFQGVTSKRFDQYILPKLHENQPDIVLLHISSNDIKNQRK